MKLRKKIKKFEITKNPKQSSLKLKPMLFTSSLFTDDYGLTKPAKNHSDFEQTPMYEKLDRTVTDQLNPESESFEREFDRYKRSLLESSKIISSDFYINDPISLMNVLKKQNETNLTLIRLLQNCKKDQKINIKTNFSEMENEMIQESNFGDSLLKEEINFQKEELNLENWKEELVHQGSDQQLMSEDDFNFQKLGNCISFDSQIFLKTSEQSPGTLSHRQASSKVGDIFFNN